MPRNGRSEQKAQGFHGPLPSGGGMGVLAVASAISVVVAAIWVLGSDARSDSRTVASPTPAASPPSVSAVDDLHERTIYVWDTATGDMRDLVSGSGLSDPELSPSGELVVYEREEADGGTQIYMLDADGVEHRLTDLPSGASDPTWSPDGRIAFSATPAEVTGLGTGTDIFVMDADGSRAHRLTGTEYDDLKPDWSPDGSRIAFHSRSDDDETWLWVASTRKHSLKEIGANGPWSAMDAAWSPDGRWIAYIRYLHVATLNGELVSELWRVRSGGMDNRRIAPLALTSFRSSPSWSPDGRLIVFEQHEWDGHQRRVGVINPWSGLTRPFLSSTPGGWWIDFEPSWSSEGILVILASADPTPAPPPLPAEFRSPPGLGGPGIDATITMTGARCELDGYRRVIHPGTLTLELVNDSHLDAHFTVVRLQGTLRDLRARYHSFFFGRPLVASVDPSTAEVWSSKVSVGVGRWAVLCHKDKIQSPNGIFIVQVGAAGPLDVG